MYQHIAPLVTGILVGIAAWLIDSVFFAFTMLNTSTLGALLTGVSPLRLSIRLLILLIAIFVGGYKARKNYKAKIKSLGLGDFDADEIFADEHQEQRVQNQILQNNQNDSAEILHGDAVARGSSYVEKVAKNPKTAIANQPAYYNQNTKAFLDKKMKALQNKDSLAYSIFDETAASGQDECQQVWQYAGKLGEVLNLSLKELEAIRTLCYCHNLGRFAVGGENEDQHAEASAKIVEDFPQLAAAADLIRNHHERWNGSGIYGLTGLEIPLGSRIFAIAWVFHALTKKNGAWRLKNDEALETLYMYSNTALDPELVAVFIGMMGKGRIMVDNTIKQTAFNI